MFHELLLALQGCTGSIFVEKDGNIEVIKGFSFIHPAEEKILDKLCHLGAAYRRLEQFINKHKFVDCGESSEGLYGLYLCAFCGGLDKVLNPYREELLKLEKDVLEDPHFSLIHFLRLEEYQLLFQVLTDMTSKIESHNVHGCGILELVHTHSRSGITVVEASLNKILHECHNVMYKQLIGWMLHGMLLDPYKEFFVQQEEPPELQCVHHQPRSGSVSELNNQLKTNEGNVQIPQKRFAFKPSLLPSYIPTHVAAKIVFVGQSVSIFGTECLDSISESEPTSVFRKEEKKFGMKLLELQKSERFSLSKFEAAINEMRNCTAEHLWQVVVEEANLLAHLRIMKDFYFLGRGELFLAFIDQANKLLKVPVTTTTEYDVNTAFQISARLVLIDDDTVAEKFYVSLQTKNKRQHSGDKESLAKAKLETGWSSIGLLYEVPSPLHILLTPTVIDRYNVIFRFLLAVRRVQSELHQCWATQMRQKGVGRESSFMPLWQLRSHMTFLIDNLQYYLQVDVLESQFAALLEKVKTVKDFEAIQQSHDQFLTSVTSQCFLQLQPVFHSLQEILDLCLSFCGMMSRISGPLSHREQSHLGNLIQNFQRQTFLLFRILSGVRSHQVSPHLGQLLLRIDYNKYLSSCGGHLGGADSTSRGSRNP